MKQKTHKDFERWIKKQIDRFLPMLHLTVNNVEVEFNERTEYLEITCTYPYLDPTIRYSERAFSAWKTGKLPPDRILHELCHIITDPFYVKAIARYSNEQEILDERERLTDTLCAIVRSLTK